MMVDKTRYYIDTNSRCYLDHQYRKTRCLHGDIGCCSHDATVVVNRVHQNVSIIAPVV